MDHESNAVPSGDSARDSCSADLRQFTGLPEACVYPAGTELLRQGHQIRTIHLIEEGMAKLVYSSETGKEVIVGLRDAGYMLGVVEALLGAPSLVTARTLIPTSTFCF